MRYNDKSQKKKARGADMALHAPRTQKRMTDYPQNEALMP